MAFPTTPTLDSFTRADENPLSDGGNWSQAGVLGGGTSADCLQLASNLAEGAVSGSECTSYWTRGPVSGYMEVWCTIGTVGGQAVELWAMCPNPSGARSGYRIFTTSSSLTLARANAGSFSTLTTASQTVSAGDSFGMSIDASGHIQMYYKASGGSWGTIGTQQTDTTFASGYIALACLTSAGAGTATAFGGSTPASATFVPSRMPLGC